MLKNYLKITVRRLVNNKVTSIINIFGLAVGMAVAILIFEWGQNEVSYDQFHANKDNLYKVWNRTLSSNGPVNCWPVMAPPVGLELKRQFPQVSATARVDWPADGLVRYGDKEIVTSQMKADKSFLTMFSFQLIRGNSAHALDGVNDIVITAKAAKKIFGTADPINKVIKLNNKDNYKITGILKDLPDNTEFKFDCLLPLTDPDKFDAAAWRDHQYLTYVQLRPGTSPENFNQTIKNLVIEHAPDAGLEIFLQPAGKWHLYTRFENGKEAGGLIETIRLMFYIACLILLIACVNFMNLGTAQSEKRAKEVGVRKVIGATRSVLIKQFLGESVLVTFIAGILAVLLVETILPVFNQLVDKKLTIGFNNPMFWLTGIGFILVTGLLAGSYPALFLSSYRPVKVLKGIFTGKSRSVNPRKVLVVFQFTAAIVLIVSTLIIYQQLQYIQQRDEGYLRNNLVQHRINGDIGKNYELIKNELLSSGAAISVCKTGLTITQDNGSATGFQWGDMSPDQKLIQFSEFATTGNLVNTMGLKLIAGRDIDLIEYPTDSAAILINQTAVKVTGLKSPIGQVIKSGPQNLTIVGVVKDFVNGEPGQKVGPMIIFGSKYWHNNIAFRLNRHNTVAKNLKIVAGIFKKYNPSYPFNYHFADDDYSKKFEEEMKAGQLAGIFAGLTIFISCMGLFGLAAHMAEKRTKEIGIRKVLGASVTVIVRLFTREFVMLIIISIITAAPIGWWLMNKWLQGYSYRIDISWLTFAAAGLAAVLIAVLTVSFHAVKASLANPVRSLKAE